METSVILPCWIIDNTLLQLTHRCVESIMETSNVELILVNNGSTLWSDYLDSEADIVIKFDTNNGYVKAINSGFKKSSGNYLVAGNNDFRLYSGWEEEMKNVLNNVSFCGISCLHTIGSEKHENYWVEHSTPGGWWMIKKETLDKVGYLDERFFNVFGDFDLCWRLKELGLDVVSSSKVSIEHHGEASLSRFTGRSEEWKKGRSLLGEKWENHPRYEEFISYFSIERNQDNYESCKSF